ncbi:MAG TPA: pyruvate ferredoxin oxidoreductase [bacterium]|nr:pyruvate ferredoxin oxidoreductase [bacterium]
MAKVMEGSRAVAELVRLCEPGVVSAYPITPQTHIVEYLAKFKADGLATYEYVRAESEFTAASVVLGASASGVRVYSATSSQGLLLMTEVLFNIAGMRLPVVMTCANRSVSAPINIWNDQQDALTIRDSGWLMFYGETVQEVLDLHLLAYKVAEQLSLPVMVNMDGFILTHTFEPVDIPGKKMIKQYLPNYKPVLGEVLDPKLPKSFGCFVGPKYYFEIRKELFDNVVSSLKVIQKEALNFKKIFKRDLSPVEYFGDKQAKLVFVTMGSVAGTVKDFIEKHNKKSKDKLGLLKLRCFRPFPTEEIFKILGKAKKVAVLDKSVSMGAEGVLSGEMKRAFYGRKTCPLIKNYILGLGGRDITSGILGDIFEDLKKSSQPEVVFKGK